MADLELLNTFLASRGSWKLDKFVQAFRNEHALRISRRQLQQHSHQRSEASLGRSLKRQSKSQQALVPKDHRRYKPSTVEQHLQQCTFKPRMSRLSLSLANRHYQKKLLQQWQTQRENSSSGSSEEEDENQVTDLVSVHLPGLNYSTTLTARRSVKFEQHRRRFSHYMLNLDREAVVEEYTKREDEEQMKECTFHPATTQRLSPAKSGQKDRESSLGAPLTSRRQLSTSAQRKSIARLMDKERFERGDKWRAA